MLGGVRVRLIARVALTLLGATFFALLAASCVTPPPPPTGTITGTVTNAVGGAPLAGVTVTARRAADGVTVASTTSAANGTYTLAVVAGTYRVELRLGSIVSFWPNEATFADGDDLVVTTGNTSTADAAFAPQQGRIKGRVTDVDTAGGLNGIQVSALRAGDGGVVATTTTSTVCAFFTCITGYYSMPNLPVDTYRVRYTRNTVNTYWPAATSFADGGDVAVTDGGTTTADAAISTQYGTIRGRATRASNGAPIGYVTASVHRASDGQIVASTVGAEDGYYNVPDLPVGTYRVQFDHDDWIAEWWNDKATFATATDVVVTKDSTTVADAALLFGPEHCASSNWVPGADLHDCDLTGGDFTGRNLTGANLSGANLTGVDLATVNLSAANLSGANLTDVVLFHVQMICTFVCVEQFTPKATIAGADFSSANLTGVEVSPMNLSGLDFSGANLTNMQFFRVKLDCTFGPPCITTFHPKADVSGLRIDGADLTGARMTHQQLLGTNHDWTGTNLSLAGHDFIYSDCCSGTELSYPVFDYIDFAGGGWSLRGATLPFIMYRANFAGMDLTGTRFVPIEDNVYTPPRPNLGEAIFTGATMDGTVITGSDLSLARGLTQAQLLATDRDWTAVRLSDDGAGNGIGDELAGVDFASGGFALSGVHMKGLGLMGANFAGLDLTGADFGRYVHHFTIVPTVLSNASFAGADLTNAKFAHANLGGATLLGATGAPTGGSTAAYNTTTCPDGVVTDEVTILTCVGHGLGS